MIARNRPVGLARAPWIALAIGGALACSDARQPPQPASFDRPTDVDFVCVLNQRVAPLTECDVESPDRALHALVTQSARGEVAAVNLRTDRILDNRRDVPGYTFVPTGELPIAIVASRLRPEHTYVASYGSRDVRVMRTEVLLGLSPEEPDAQEPVSLTVDGDGGAFGGTPSDMVLLPDESALIVTLSDVGRVARLPLDGEGLIDTDGVTFIDLPSVVPPAPVPIATEDRYALICGDFERPPLPPVTEPEPPVAGQAPRPVALAIDRSCERCGDGRVLVADEALPALHVLDIAALAAGGDPLLAPIPTGSPTRDIVVTPRVPASFPPTDGEADSTYFLYAIDAVDGSVMALEDDQVLAMNRHPGGRVDRLPITDRSGGSAPIALTLEVVTPDFRLSGDPAQYVQLREAPGAAPVSSRNVCLDDAHIKVTPRRLRGVFLSAALADGTVRIIDIHDRELLVCRDCDSADAPAPILVRHHPRIVTDPIAELEGDRELLRPVAVARVGVETGVFNVRNNGSVASPLAPQLGCFACDEGYEQALPDPDDQMAAGDLAEEDAGAGDEAFAICEQALVCGIDDPWAGSLDNYTFSYEASVPDAGGGDGRFVPAGEPGNVTNVLELHSALPFCARGVLGTDDIGGAFEAERCDRENLDRFGGLIGDRVEITSELLSDAALAALGRNEEERAQCAMARAALDEEDTATISLEILAAFEDRLALRTSLNPPLNRPGMDWTLIPTCLGEGAVTFRVRAQNGFLVFTTNEGWNHNVIANAQGRCVVDAMSGAGLSRRTWTGCAYKDERLQLQILPFEEDEGRIIDEPGGGSGVILNVNVATSAQPLVMNASQLGFGFSSVLPSRLRYNPADEQLYLVDTYQGGLIPIDLDPFRDTPITSFY